MNFVIITIITNMFTESHKKTGIVDIFDNVSEIVSHYKTKSLNAIMDNIDDGKYTARQLGLLQTHITVALRKLNNK